jgi:hypothetical protein
MIGPIATVVKFIDRIWISVDERLEDPCGTGVRGRIVKRKATVRRYLDVRSFGMKG